MKITFSNNVVGRLRVAGITEGISFLVLLFIAMPLKYFAGYPLAVKYVGWAHGLLFILYVAALADVRFSRQWPFKRLAVAFVASLVPFGTFLLDPKLRAEEKMVEDKK